MKGNSRTALLPDFGQPQLKYLDSLMHAHFLNRGIEAEVSLKS